MVLLIDANIILDVLLNRQKFVKDFSRSKVIAFTPSELLARI
nr:hypothetical protein [uncultured Anaerostipes sp.]